MPLVITADETGCRYQQQAVTLELIATGLTSRDADDAATQHRERFVLRCWMRSTAGGSASSIPV